MVPEAPMEDGPDGKKPAGEGWFVVNAREGVWIHNEKFGAGVTFEGTPDFPHCGINIQVMWPGQPNCYYHAEEGQEDFLILSGECLLLVEGEERPLRQWDFVHCPPEVSHTIVGAGSGPAAIVAVGARAHQTREDWGAYPYSDVAVRHNAGAERETDDPKEAYARFPAREPSRYRDGWLP